MKITGFLGWVAALLPIEARRAQFEGQHSSTGVSGKAL